MAARNRVGLSEQTRLRIKTTMITKRLEDHIANKCEMTQTQISAAKILLDKTLPNLQSIEMKAEVTTKDANELTEAELLDIASSGSSGAVSEERSEKKSDSVH